MERNLLLWESQRAEVPSSVPWTVCKWWLLRVDRSCHAGRIQGQWFVRESHYYWSYDHSPRMASVWESLKDHLDPALLLVSVLHDQKSRLRTQRKASWAWQCQTVTCCRRSSRDSTCHFCICSNFVWNRGFPVAGLLQQSHQWVLSCPLVCLHILGLLLLPARSR